METGHQIFHHKSNLHGISFNSLTSIVTDNWNKHSFCACLLRDKWQPNIGAIFSESNHLRWICQRKNYNYTSKRDKSFLNKHKYIALGPSNFRVCSAKRLCYLFSGKVLYWKYTNNLFKNTALFIIICSVIQIVKTYLRNMVNVPFRGNAIK